MNTKIKFTEKFPKLYEKYKLLQSSLIGNENFYLNDQRK